MELEAEGGSSRIVMESGSGKMELGRGHGIASSDRTIARRQVSFEAHENEARVSFEVLGRNPVIVVTEGGIKKLFRSKETGDIVPGDRISLSIKEPVFFSLKIFDGEGAREKEISDAEEKGFVEKVDFEIGDPVKEFGLIARGHEFDRYGRRIQEPAKWNWFLEEQREDSETEEEEETKKRKKVRKKGKQRGEEDEEWTGDSEEEEIELTKAGSAGRRSGYLTRSKSPHESPVRNEGRVARKRKLKEEDEEDETLGGFIVDDNGDEGEMQRDDEEEEEFEDDDDDDDE